MCNLFDQQSMKEPTSIITEALADKTENTINALPIMYKAKFQDNKSVKSIEVRYICLQNCAFT